MLDAAVRILAGSDNSAEDVSAFWRAIGELQREGAAVAVAHHVGWSATNRSRGSTDWTAGTDVEVHLSRSDQRERLRLSWTKVKDGDLRDPISIELDIGAETSRLRCAGTVEDERLNGRDLDLAVLAFLAQCGGSGSREQLLKQFRPDGKGARSLDAAFERLKEAEKIDSREGQYALL